MRRSAASFNDVSAKMPDPTLVERQRRMRKIVGWVMVSALGLLVLAGVCSLVRKPDQGPAARSIAAPPAAVVPPVAAPIETAPAPALAAAVEPEAASPAPARPQAHPRRAKPAPPRNARTP